MDYYGDLFEVTILQKRRMYKYVGPKIEELSFALDPIVNRPRKKPVRKVVHKTYSFKKEVESEKEVEEEIPSLTLMLDKYSNMPLQDFIRMFRELGMEVHFQINAKEDK